MPRRPRITFIPAGQEREGARLVPEEAQREALSAWMQSTVEAIETEAAERIERLRNVGEHPSPVFARMVREHARLRMPHAHIAALMCVSVATIEKHYADEMIAGEAEAMVNVTRNMLRIATSLTDASAAKVGLAWLERAAKEKWAAPEPKKIEVAEVKATPVIDSSLLTEDERAQLDAMLNRVSALQAARPVPVESTDADNIDGADSVVGRGREG